MRVLALSLLALGTTSCADEELRELVPWISLCPAVDAAPEQCDGVIDAGELPVEIAAIIEVAVVNRGDGRLAVDGYALDHPALTVELLPEDVAPRSGKPLSIATALGADALGPGSAELSVVSSDRAHSPASVQLTWVGVPPPQPGILLCDGEGEGAPCAVPLDVDLGRVRPTQATSRIVTIRSVGEDPLDVERVRLSGSSDFSLGSSSQGARLAPGESAAVVVIYAPAGDGDDAAILTVDSNDRDTPAATVNLRGTGGDDQPPTAACQDSVTGGTTSSARVDDLVGIDGTASSDPEGDPLVFQWALTAPAGSSATIVDGAARSALFTPDARGTFVVTLVVRDSLGQPSVPCTVTVDAVARYSLRARARWGSGGDVDLHLVESGSALFSARDVRYDNRAVDAFLLLDDAESGPGEEEIAGPLPAGGTWELWLQLFDDAGLGAVDATLEVVLDDTLPASFSATGALPASCALWHVSDVTFPSGTVTPVNATMSLCP
ncbi:MAG: choice-of-anchor D domain-containing protein [Deltaproteobacteria bacterium]|nr:choice-of-anchor D domain-containing protein [Deltaproteobacteria bacterium]